MDYIAVFVRGRMTLSAPRAQTTTIVSEHSLLLNAITEAGIQFRKYVSAGKTQW